MIHIVYELHTSMSIILQLDNRYILRVPNADIQFNPRIRNAVYHGYSYWRLLSVRIVASSRPSLLVFSISRKIAMSLGGRKGERKTSRTSEKLSEYGKMYYDKLVLN